MLFTLVPTSIDDAYGEAILTLAQAKAHLHVDASDEDDLIKALRNASIDMVQQYSGTRLKLTTGLLARFAGFGDSMRAGIGPAATVGVTAVSYVDTTGATVNLTSTDWRVGVDGRLLPAIGASWPEAGGPVTVTFSAGFAAGQCPGALVSAVKLMLGHLFANREAVVTSGTVSELPLGVQSLCDLYRAPVI